jgi:hypothetical protein
VLNFKCNIWAFSDKRLEAKNVSFKSVCFIITKLKKKNINKCECISYEVPNAPMFMSFKMSEVFNVGYAVRILIEISRVEHLLHYSTAQVYKLNLPGSFRLVQHTTHFTLKPNKKEMLELLENVHLPHTDSYNLHNEHKTRKPLEQRLKTTAFLKFCNK